MLPNAVIDELLAGMAGFGACGFHTERWATGYRACHDQLSPDRAPPSTFVSGLGSDANRLLASVAQPEVELALGRLESEIGGPDRQVILRVDRMELSKNILRGFWAYEELLAYEPEWRERVVFVALAYPSRQGLAEYLAYQNEVESTVARINRRWATPGWTPIVLHVEDDYPRSLAALTRYDVLLVNPIRDGMNLVAKEGPVLNTADGVLALVYLQGRRLRGTGRPRLGDQPLRCGAARQPSCPKPSGWEPMSEPPPPRRSGSSSCPSPRPTGSTTSWRKPTSSPEQHRLKSTTGAAAGSGSPGPAATSGSRENRYCATRW